MNKKQLYLLLFCTILSTFLTAQSKPLTYYLPDIEYDNSIPTPESVLGYQIGDWHISHDQQLMYMRLLAASSPRVTLTEFAKTYEGRPLVYLTITSEKNHARLADIKTQRQQLTNPKQSGKLNLDKMPAVVYQGYSIHGNEPSGGNAAPLYAYYLAAAKDKAVLDALDEVVVLLDPCYNPDGFNRFASWVNTHKSKTLVSDPQTRQYDEAWPRGRTNHYWFDLNRDWLPTQHPESQGRIRNFHEWKPNILTDHHEMGSNATFFFQPGVPQRTNPLTPKINQELTKKIGTYHAAALDAIGSLYYSEESYDDFYYGKGSTYPDVNGAIGILFEQASSRGHLQETENGLLSFPFTIRNQVATSLSTLEAAVDMRVELMEMQRNFYQNAAKEAQSAAIKGYVFQSLEDPIRAKEFAAILLRHQIEVHQLGSNTQANNTDFLKNKAYVVNTNQAQHRIIRAIFERTDTFQDSLFYDVSAWTLPLAFNLEYAALESIGSSMTGQTISAANLKQHTPTIEKAAYAYLLDWKHYYAPAALNQILKHGLRAKVSTEKFGINDQLFNRGTISIPVHNQSMDSDAIYELMQSLATDYNVPIHALQTGLTPTGYDIGTRSAEILKKPEVCMIVGNGINSYDAGEVWHLLDQRYDMQLTMIPTSDLDRVNLDRYTTIILPDGSYYAVGVAGINKLQEWTQAGGTIVAMKRAINWLKSKNMAAVQSKSFQNPYASGKRPYAFANEDRGSNVLGGAIFENTLDLTHPLCYGYTNETLPVFRKGSVILKQSDNPYATPLTYTKQPLLSGYASKANQAALSESAGIIVSGHGRGRVICMVDNPNFRAFWYGGNKLMANAIFFGHTISSQTVER